MTVRECYDAIGGNYDEVFERLGDEEFIKQLLIMFISDTNLHNLISSYLMGDYENAFCYAHGFKGVIQNLSLNSLLPDTTLMTEKMRKMDSSNVVELFEKMKNEYLRIVNLIKKLL